MRPILFRLKLTKTVTKKEDLESAMSNQGWKRLSDDAPVDLTAVSNEGRKDVLYYKEEPYTTKKLQQRMIITFSPKYAAYQKKVREEQVHRALMRAKSLINRYIF